jgi:hypothetical protein
MGGLERFLCDSNHMGKAGRGDAGEPAPFNRRPEAAKWTRCR